VSRELRWRFRRFGKRLRRIVCSRLYRDEHQDVRRSCLIAGTARSGTTWLAEVVASQRPCRVMFEPFNPGKVRAYARFHYFQYMRPGDSNDELKDFCRRIFTGRVRDAWIDREVDVLRPGYRVVKDIRANLMMKWLHREFPEVPMLLLVRHPCAVVASRMKLGWATDTDIASFTSQRDLVRDFLAEQTETIEQARTDEAKHAVIWCVSNLVPLVHFAAGGLMVVFYEELCAHPEAELARVFSRLGADHRASVFDKLAAPSMTTRPRSAVLTGDDRLAAWSQELSARQVRNVLEVVERFGLSHLYGESTMPQSRVASA
jgi:Sulfotransferase family